MPRVFPSPRRLVLATVAACATLLVAACAINRDTLPTPAMATISGTVTYRERIALPPDAVVQLAVADVTAPDAPPRVIADVSFATEGRQVPLPYSLTFDASRLVPGRAYAVAVVIAQGGRTLFFTADRSRIDPTALPSRLDVVVVPAPGTN